MLPEKHMEKEIVLKVRISQQSQQRPGNPVVIQVNESYLL